MSPLFLTVFTDNSPGSGKFFQILHFLNFFKDLLPVGSLISLLLVQIYFQYTDEM